MRFRIRHILIACVSLVVVAGFLAAPTGLRAQGRSSQETKVITAVVERVDKIARSVTAKAEDGKSYTVFCGPELKVFDDLKVGDTVTARFVETYLAAVKPGAKTQFMADTTAAAKGASTGQADVVQQMKMTVEVEGVDPKTRTVLYKTSDNRHVTKQVADAKLIEGLKKGDIVEVTYTKERAVELKKGK